MCSEQDIVKKFKSLMDCVVGYRYLDSLYQMKTQFVFEIQKDIISLMPDHANSDDYCFNIIVKEVETQVALQSCLIVNKEFYDGTKRFKKNMFRLQKEKEYIRVVEKRIGQSVLDEV